MALTQKQKDRAKAYRDKLRSFAVAGGYVPTKREGSGLTVKKTSSKGTVYYYQPWSTLTDEQKRKRLDYSKKYSKQVRAEAAAYRREHGK